jgi:hypothetical protein
VVGAREASRVGAKVIASASEVGGLEGLLTVGLPILGSLVGVMVIAAGSPSSPEVGAMVIASASEVGGVEGLLTVGLPILASLVGVMVIAAEVTRYTIIAPIAAPNTYVNTGKHRTSFLRFADDSL